MLAYIIRRLLLMIPMVAVLSLVVFLVVAMAPGDIVQMRVQNLAASGVRVSQDEVVRLRLIYGVDEPILSRYYKWITNVVLRGNLGYSGMFNRPNSDLLAEAVPVSLGVALAGLLLTWMIALPVGIYSATHQYSINDYIFTFLSFFGLGTPGFLIALIFAWLSMSYFNFSPMGLVSPQFANQPWDWAKIANMAQHLWLPVVLAGLTSTGGMMRTMRNNLLDQLKQPYVTTARAKGLSEWRLLLKYPVRLAINPIVSSIAFVLPQIFAGDVVIAAVLGLPTLGALMSSAVFGKDMYLAGTILLFYTIVTLLGTLVSDILLAIVDPRIRFGGGVR